MTKFVIIGLSGKRGSGKDALSKKLYPFGWERYSFADELKRKIREEFGLTVEQTDGDLKEVPTKYMNEEGKYLTPRDIMTLCGQYYRAIDPLYWVKQVFKRLHETSFQTLNPIVQTRKIVITDVRFPNEVLCLAKQGGKIIRINRPQELNIYKKPLNDFSETQLDNHTFDYVIPAEKNVDFADLEREARLIDEMFKHEAREVDFNL